MKNACEIKLSLQQMIAGVEGQQFFTPSGSRTFTIHKANGERIVAVTQMSKSKIYLPISVFQKTLAYLSEHDHGQNNPCPIRSHNNPEQGGDLCIVARGGTKQRKITYILPILQHLGLVNIDSSVRPITTYAVVQA